VVDAISDTWLPLLLAAALLVSAFTSAHAVLHKRDARSAAGWTALVWLVPLLGALLYLLLGINRIRRRAISMRKDQLRYDVSGAPETPERDSLAVALSATGSHLSNLAVAIARITGRRLLSGNHIEPLVDGDAAYPAMLQAIASAERSVTFATYIFETRQVGASFVGALEAACRRGVQVRVLIDAVGARYSTPRVDRVLRKHRVPSALFMPVLPFWRAPYFNLRNHRKLMVVDGKLGFTGGINVRPDHVIADHPAYPTRDLHFRVEGPVVAQLQEVFAMDWTFSTRETLEGDLWFPEIAEAGTTLARGISDGPDEDLDKFTWTLLSALACARRSVLIMTPYFLPDSALNTALSAAALRGVEVDVLLPAQSNLRLVQWAMWRQLEEVLGHGVRVWLTPPPFDHTKLMLVDGEWSLIGSANWDTRSLRLNFEFDIECYDTRLAQTLTDYVQKRKRPARELAREELLARPAHARVRDGFARLLLPYL
jgi:cardiolipin synthase